MRCAVRCVLSIISVSGLLMLQDRKISDQRRPASTNAQSGYTASCVARILPGHTPAQAISDHMDDAADDATVINTGYSMGQRKEGFDLLSLGFCKPKLIRHQQVLLFRINHSSGRLTSYKINSA